MLPSQPAWNRFRSVSAGALRHACLPLALLCAGAAGAQQGPIAVFALDSTQVFNTGAAFTETHQFDTLNYSHTGVGNFRTVESRRSVVQTPPGIGTPGLALDYLDRTNYYDEIRSSQKTDFAYFHMAAGDPQNSNFEGGKYIELNGHLSASQDTTVSFNMHANGNYLLNSASTVPALPNYFLSSGGASLNQLFSDATTENTPDHPNSYHLYAQTDNLALTANTVFNFSAMIYAGDLLSLGDFELQLNTGAYDLTSTITQRSNTSSVLIGSHVLDPVPEPDTYALLLGGLALLGALSARRTKQAG